MSKAVPSFWGSRQLIILLPFNTDMGICENHA